MATTLERLTLFRNLVRRPRFLCLTTRPIGTSSLFSITSSARSPSWLLALRLSLLTGGLSILTLGSPHTTLLPVRIVYGFWSWPVCAYRPVALRVCCSPSHMPSTTISDMYTLVFFTRDDVRHVRPRRLSTSNFSLP